MEKPVSQKSELTWEDAQWHAWLVELCRCGLLQATDAKGRMRNGKRQREDRAIDTRESMPLSSSYSLVAQVFECRRDCCDKAVVLEVARPGK
jgi:hypothetical protein